mgnify:CR=1 FL=1
MTDISTPVCYDCLRPLTDEERHYYETRCEACEGEWQERLQRWKRGHDDAEFDQLYGG